MSRILHLVGDVDDRAPYSSALATALHEAEELRRRGHDVVLAGGWSGRGTAPDRVAGVPARLFRTRRVLPGPGRSGALSRSLLRWLDEQAPRTDVAHLHLSRDLVPLSAAARLQRLDVPYVVQTHDALGPAGTVAALLDRRFTQAALSAARAVFVSTPDERDAVTRVAGPGVPLSLLRRGVVLPDRVPAPTPDGPLDVLFMAPLAPDQRALAFAASAIRLLDGGVDATFTIVGPDGGDRRELRRVLRSRPDLAGRLVDAGPLPHRRAVERLRRAGLYVLPSVDGGTVPMTLLEALASGVPAICTTACGVAGILARDHAATVANPTDDALYGAMRRLVRDRTARARLSSRAAATAASTFAMSAVAEVLEEEYGVERPAVDVRGTDAGPGRAVIDLDRLAGGRSQERPEPGLPGLPSLPGPTRPARLAPRDAG